jgi:hypothetical protein
MLYSQAHLCHICVTSAQTDMPRRAGNTTVHSFVVSALWPHWTSYILVNTVYKTYGLVRRDGPTGATEVSALQYALIEILTLISRKDR